MSTDIKKTNVDKEATSFAEMALTLGGASADEAKRTGVLDTADDQVEGFFAPQYQTRLSPVHRAVWDSHLPTELFVPASAEASNAVEKVTHDSLDVVLRHQKANSLYDDRGKVSESVLAELGAAGYFGLLVDPKYGGSGATMTQFAKMITRMAMIEPTIAGLASVHGCIGAVDPVRSFGTDEQKQRFLPSLASGQRLSGFALTEPGAGSDLTALRTVAVREGDYYYVTGEKLFITNATNGRTVGLVCKIKDKPSVLVIDLPEQEDETFQIRRYGIYALRRAHNNGLIFRNFRVPVENLLTPAMGDGLTIAYHGLNLGRVALCANAAGTMRAMLAEMLPWAAMRVTYGQPIDRRELVRRRIGHLAGAIVSADALTAWCSGLLDQGYRGEMECIVAKIYGSEAQKEAAIEWFMKTHGGRSFLHGHTFGDNVHDFLAPCIYEGEGEMLGMAFFKSLVKHHGKEYFESIGKTLHERGVRKPNLANPSHVWMLRRPMMNYARWYLGRKFARSSATALPPLPDGMANHAKYAMKVLSRSGMAISAVMRQHQLKLADRQCRMSALSSQLQDAIVILVTALHTTSFQSSSMDDQILVAASDALCRRLRSRLTGRSPSDADFRQVTDLGKMIAEHGWKEIEFAKPNEIMMRYND
ncbi:Acyl-CoA dehydrogenase [Rubripirellula amarantea]|uniref:Acyl-CoA dehydrogenase n=1 Tax=Rubripirellula amarantea TaxID=2527999 RepID=A0A5C5WG86_9BACT|nr:acyl-CoA dehydrogenase family protein [Rubripirellula amarantea]TWT49670.1 Acyl-CoA dehydrogenase [Rubripirellula amarantea]